MNWDVLGIEETSDKKAITRAYREKLVLVNPEEKPEEFKQLRAAYETAIRLADAAGSQAEAGQEAAARLILAGLNENVRSYWDSLPEDLMNWAYRLGELYGDLSRRLKVSEWQQLMKDELVGRVDTRTQVEDIVIRLFYEHYLISPAVWSCLNDEFSWDIRRDELRDKYGQGFTEGFLVSWGEKRLAIPFELFTPGRNGFECDEYYYTFCHMAEVSPEENKELAAKIKAMKEWHPYGAMYMAMLDQNAGVDGAMDRMKELYEKYPSDRYIKHRWGSVCLENGNPQEALRIGAELREDAKCKAEPIFVRSSTNFEGCVLEAKAYVALEDYKSAIESINRSLIYEGYSPTKYAQIYEFRKGIIEELIKINTRELEKAPEDHDIRLDLAWNYYHLEDTKQAYEIARLLPEGLPEPFSYYNIMSGLEYSNGSKEKALQNLIKLVEVVKGLQDDGTDKTRERMLRLPEMYSRLIDIYREKLYPSEEEKSDLIKVVEEAREICNGGNYENCADLFRSLAQYEFSLGHHEIALEYYDRCIGHNSSNEFAHYIKYIALYRLRRDREALDEIERAISCAANQAPFYYAKIFLFIRNGLFREAEELIGMLEEAGLGETEELLYAKGAIAYYQADDNDKAMDYYTKVVEKLWEAENKDYWFSNFCLDAAYLLSDLQRDPKGGHVNREEVLKYLEMAISEDKWNLKAKEFRAYIHQQNGNNDKAFEDIKDLENSSEFSDRALYQHAKMLYESVDEKAPECLEIWDRLIQRRPESAEYYFYKGMCHLKMEQFEEAEKAFLKVEELESDVVDGYYRLAQTYEDMNRWEDAIVELEKGFEISKGKIETRAMLLKEKVMILRRLGRYQEAIDCLTLLGKSYRYEQYLADIIEVMLQAGWLIKARDEVRAWQASGIMKSEVYDAINGYYRLAGEYSQAGRINRRGHSLNRLTHYEFNNLMEQLYFAMGDMRKVIKHCEIMERSARNKGAGAEALVLDRLLVANVLLGRNEMARKYAERLTKLMDEYPQYRREKAYQLTKRCLAEAVLHGEEAGRKLIEEARRSPLCNFCNYCKCKDATLFEIEMDIMSHKILEAYAHIEEAIKLYPDEADFIGLKNFLRNYYDNRN